MTFAAPLTAVTRAAILVCAVLFVPAKCLAQTAPTYCCVYNNGGSCEVLAFAACSSHQGFSLSPTLSDVCLRRQQGGFYCGAGNSTPVPSATFVNYLLTRTFAWIDNGNQIGTITFTQDGVARVTWTPGASTWRIDTNGDLVITDTGADYVVRLTFDGTSAFLGRRDPTSRVQDGVQTQLRPL
jgi:hypothetical protein